jgi:hypothetical protein
MVGNYKTALHFLAEPGEGSFYFFFFVNEGNDHGRFIETEQVIRAAQMFAVKPSLPRYTVAPITFCLTKNCRMYSYRGTSPFQWSAPMNICACSMAFEFNSRMITLSIASPLW